MKDPKQVLVDKIESQLGITAVLIKELKKLVADMPDDITPTAGDNQFDARYEAMIAAYIAWPKHNPKTLAEIKRIAGVSDMELNDPEATT